MEAVVYVVSFAGGLLVDPTDHKAAASGLLPIDSLNIWPLISGQTTTSPREELLINANTLIEGEWKVSRRRCHCQHFIVSIC